jgi:hypothetical protein
MFRKFLSRTKLYVFAIPLLLWAIGAGLNQVAINANHDTMPALHNLGNIEEFVHDGFPIIQNLPQGKAIVLTDERHSILTEDSHFYVLCDIIDFGDIVYSVGDVFIIVGEKLGAIIPYIWGLALYAQSRRKEDENQ